MAKYDYTNYNKFSFYYVPQDQKDQFQAFITEGQMISKASLQGSLDAVNTAFCSMAVAIIMNHTSWLQFSGLLREVQNTMEDL